MKISVIGIGNIGLITALCFAKKGYKTCAFDIDSQKINSLKNMQTYFFEPHLNELLDNNLSSLYFSNFPSDLLNPTSIIFLTVGTPTTQNGGVDLSAVDDIIGAISSISTSSPIIIRSTVPPGTHRRLAKLYPQLRFISSPEFLREGSAIHDCLNPDRIIVGSDSPEDLEFFKELYKDFNLKSEQFLFMDPTSAEMSKYAANIFLANRISLINEFSRISEKVGADIQHIQKALATDPRIGPDFLNAGLGYGGSCFPKDLEAFVHFAANHEEPASITESVHRGNQQQIQYFIEKIKRHLPQKNNIQYLTIWGLSFKPNTDDLREAPALKVAEALLQEGLNLKLYDPKALDNLQKLFANHPQVTICSSAQEAAQESSAIILCTEWPEFSAMDLSQVKTLMKEPVFFDGRNVFEASSMKELGFQYYSVGRPI